MHGNAGEGGKDVRKQTEFSTEVVEARMIDCGAGCPAATVARPTRTKHNSKGNFRSFITSPKAQKRWRSRRC
jgi:hypothetical protein